MQPGCWVKPGRICSVAYECPRVLVAPEQCEGLRGAGLVHGDLSSSASGLLEFSCMVIAKQVCCDSTDAEAPYVLLRRDVVRIVYLSGKHRTLNFERRTHAMCCQCKRRLLEGIWGRQTGAFSPSRFLTFESPVQ